MAQSAQNSVRRATENSHSQSSCCRISSSRDLFRYYYCIVAYFVENSYWITEYVYIVALGYSQNFSASRLVFVNLHKVSYTVHHYTCVTLQYGFNLQILNMLLFTDSKPYATYHFPTLTMFYKNSILNTSCIRFQDLIPYILLGP